jgi:hypothetical protein
MTGPESSLCKVEQKGGAAESGTGMYMAPNRFGQSELFITRLYNGYMMPWHTLIFFSGPNGGREGARRRGAVRQTGLRVLERRGRHGGEHRAR